MRDDLDKLYFSGIGGSGMSSIAGFVREKGCEVYGSDRAFSNGVTHPALTALLDDGVNIVPQDGKALDESFGLAVFSTAVESGSPDYARAEGLGIRTASRPDFLRDITNSYKTVAVAGTSGKSTASGMLAHTMKALGLEPNFIGGARVINLRGEGRSGSFLTGSSDLLVIEACESDGSIINFRPEHTLILNLDQDHQGVEETAAMFVTLLENTSGMKVLNADDDKLKTFIPPGSVTFAIDRNASYRAERVVLKGLNSAFWVNGKEYLLAAPGRHNVYNALSVIAFLSEFGIKAGDIAKALADFRGIERRFEVHLNGKEGFVVDDYAHNPHKIASLMATVSGIQEKVCYVFQPHGFGPTRMLKEGYIDSFYRNLRPNDSLFVLPIYYAGGSAIMDISSEEIASGVRLLGGRAKAVRSRRDLIGRLSGEDDCVVVFGARDESLSGFAGEIASTLRERSARR